MLTSILSGDSTWHNFRNWHVTDQQKITLKCFGIVVSYHLSSGSRFTAHDLPFSQNLLWQTYMHYNLSESWLRTAKTCQLTACCCQTILRSDMHGTASWPNSKVTINTCLGCYGSPAIVLGILTQVSLAIVNQPDLHSNIHALQTYYSICVWSALTMHRHFTNHTIQLTGHGGRWCDTN